MCVVGEFVGKELQGDVATELQVFRLVHHTHPAATNPAEYAVMRNRLPNGLGGVDTGGNVTGKLAEGQLDGREPHARGAELALVIVFLSLANAGQKGFSSSAAVRFD